MVASKAGDEGPTKTLRAFFDRVAGLTDDPLHARLLKAAEKREPQAALEREFEKAIKEILDEA